MIKINNKYSFERDQYCWHLHEKYMGEDKHHQPKEFIRTTYHPSLEYIAKHLIDKGCGELESLQEIIVFLETTAKSIAQIFQDRLDSDNK